MVDGKYLFRCDCGCGCTAKVAELGPCPSCVEAEVKIRQHDGVDQ